MNPGDENGFLIDRFTDALWLEEGLSEHTLKAYASDLKQFSRWLRKPLVEAVRGNCPPIWRISAVREVAPEAAPGCFPVCADSMAI